MQCDHIKTIPNPKYKDWSRSEIREYSIKNFGVPKPP